MAFWSFNNSVHSDNDSEKGDNQLQLPFQPYLNQCVLFLSCRVLECQGLPIVNGQCDPYATVTLAGPYR